jgi:hypothetical protein
MSPITMNKADEISQNEKREVMKNDRLNTYQAHAAASIDEERGGRFSVQTKPTVIGQSPISYPKQPPNSPWASDDLLGPEPPLGIDINAMQPVGEPHELKASERTEPAPAAPINQVSAANSIRLRRRI